MQTATYIPEVILGGCRCSGIYLKFISSNEEVEHVVGVDVQYPRIEEVDDGSEGH